MPTNPLPHRCHCLLTPRCAAHIKHIAGYTNNNQVPPSLTTGHDRNVRQILVSRYLTASCSDSIAINCWAHKRHKSAQSGIVVGHSNNILGMML